jgi:hypothetical protein
MTARDDSALLATVLAWVGTHQFDYTEWDTGVSKCRHPDHIDGYSASCARAALRSDVPEVFRP